MIEADLQPKTVGLLAEALAFVGTMRPALPGKTAEQSALKLIAAYLRAHHPDLKSGSEHLEYLIERCKLVEKCTEIMDNVATDSRDTLNVLKIVDDIKL